MDIDQGEIGKNYPVEIGIISDAKAGLTALLEALKANFKPKKYRATAWFKSITTAKKAWARHLKKWEDPKRDPMMITSLLRETREFLNRDALFHKRP